MRIAIAAAVLAFTAAGAALADPPVPTTRSETEQAAQGAAAPAAHSDSHDGMGHSDKTAPKTPQIMPGYGNGGFRMTTRVPEAQAFFDNGMTLAHAFAHEAAVGAMKEAARLDPACAMCLWGQAWADGPTINYGKSEAEIAPLAEMADKAAELAKTNGTDRERALIRALQLRYVDGGGGKPGDLAFAKAMTALAGRYPKDDEIAIMTADAWLMTETADEQGWALNANLAMPFLESVLRRNPDSTGAIHFYIHATEIAGEPALAEEHADRLIALAPRASHLVHMPSHTYYWVGRYQDAADVNMRAVEIGIENARELGLPAPDGVWGLPYHAHNVTYGLGGALEAGDAKTALALARPLVERSQTRDGASAYSQLVGANGYLALAQFAPPEEILALPEPRSSILAAAWHYARGEARFRQVDAPGVRAEADVAWLDRRYSGRRIQAGAKLHRHRARRAGGSDGNAGRADWRRRDGLPPGCRGAGEQAILQCGGPACLALPGAPRPGRSLVGAGRSCRGPARGGRRTCLSQEGSRHAGVAAQNRVVRKAVT